jgi:hypothetical protein
MKFSRVIRSCSPIILLGACLAATAQSSSNPVSLEALRAACSDDAARLCAGVPPGGGRVIACLQQHQDSLSDKCRQAAGLAPQSKAVAATSAPSPSPAPSTTPSLPSPEPSYSSPAHPAPAIGAPTKIVGEEFVRRAITDPGHSNMVAATIRLPEKWKLDSKVEWHYDWIENPLAFSASATNPGNSEAFNLYPLLRLEWTEVPAQYRQYLKYNQAQSQPGQRIPTGAINMQPMPPVQALAMFIKQVRPNATNLKWLGQQDLPQLAHALQLAPWPNDSGVAIKISYDLNGQPVEEAFFGVYYSSQGGYGGIKQTNWGFRALESFRAPAGALDKRMPVFCLIAKSVTDNPQWDKLTQSIHDQLMTAFNQKLKQGYDQIRAAHEVMEQTMAQERTFDAGIAKQDAALRSPGFDDSWLRTSDGGGSGGATRSSADHFDDNIRGVDTLNDPSTGGTTQLSNLGQYHFTDGFGNYRTSDDPNYTPEKAGEVGTWTPMTTAQ